MPGRYGLCFAEGLEVNHGITCGGILNQAAGLGESVDVIVLLHNDELTLPLIFAELEAKFREIPQLSTIILVDSASPDRCGAIADDLAAGNPDLVEVVHVPLSGYANAVRHGLARSSADWVVIIDGDREYPVAYLPQVIQARAGVDFVLTKRLVKPYSRFRRLASRVYNWLVRRLFQVGFSDIGSGLRAYSRPVFQGKVFHSDSAFIAAEIPILAVTDLGRSGRWIEVSLIPELNRHRPTGIMKFRQVVAVLLEICCLKVRLIRRRK